MEIEVFTEGKLTFPYKNITVKQIKTFLINISNYLNLNNCSISLILTDNAYIHQINKDYRKKDKATDVISFAYRDTPFPDIDLNLEPLGDIYISLEKAEENADAYDIDFDVELKRLLVHGALHLVGYDHEKSKKEENRMKREEEKILKLLIIKK